MKPWNRYRVLNLINEKYDLYPFEITCKEEAEDFLRNYFGPVADILPRIENIDADIVLAIIDNWHDREDLSKAVVPLLSRSTIAQAL